MIGMCAGLMRTGSVALFQLMRAVVVYKDIGHAPKLPVGSEGTYFNEHVEEWANVDEMIVLKLHRWRESLAGHEHRMRTIVTIRDMRDVVVSLMNFRSTTFEKALASNAVTRGNVPGQAEWMEKVPSPNLLLLRYEDFVTNRETSTQMIARHLGTELSIWEASNIEQAWSIDANKRRARSNHNVTSENYMAKRHIHSGFVDQWKTALTQEQAEKVVETIGSKWFMTYGYDPSCS